MKKRERGRPKGSKHTLNINIRVDSSTIVKLGMIAAEMGCTESEAVRRLIANA